MRWRSVRRPLLASSLVGAVLASGALTFKASAWDSAAVPAVVRHDYHCGTNDKPEPKLQGQVPKEDQASGRAKQGYNCGLQLVGFTPLNKTVGGTDSRPNANANMAWAGSCAFVSGSASSLFNPPVLSKPVAGTSGGPGVAVIDVHRSNDPKMVRVLRQPGAAATSETLGARTAPDGRAILVVGQYGNDPVSDPKPMDIYLYDTRRPCDTLEHVPNPKNPDLATYYWPKNIHNLTVSPDLNYVYATIPVQAIDLSGMWAHVGQARAADHIRYIGNLNDSLNAAQEGVGPQNDLVPPAANPAHPQVADNSHEAWVEDNKTLYIGGQTPTGEILTIVDVRKWLTGSGPPAIVSQTAGRGHSVRIATINGHRYLLHSEESVFGTAYGCVPQMANPFAGAAQPWLTNIDDPTRPVLASQMGLQINEPQNCQAQLNDGENDSVHYHDVDDALNTHFVMASMWNAGIRVFDVRNPQSPTEVAYFNPADIAPRGQPTQLDHVWGHVRYDAKSGNIWFASALGGFFVVRLENQVRSQLRLTGSASSTGAAHPRTGADVGWPGTKGISFPKPAYGYVDVTPYYCTLATLRQHG